MELSAFDFKISHCPGKLNIPPDTLSRAFCAVTQVTSLHKIHEALCHPGITRLFHFVHAKNLPFSVDDVRKTVGKCLVCSEIKPRFYTPPVASLVKATQPFERLSFDFKGPLPSTSKNRYLLTIVDEFSRFPFAFPCRSTDATTVIAYLNDLFAVFGTCAYIHSDCGSAFLSTELVSYLHCRGIACSRTSVYNPCGNGQCERYNGYLVCGETCTEVVRFRDLAMGRCTSTCLALDPFPSVHCNQRNPS